MSSGDAPRLHRSVGYTHRISRLLLIHPSSFRFAISVSSTYCSCLPIRYVLCCGRDCLFPPSPPSARFAQYALSGGPSVCLSLSVSLPLCLSLSNTAPVSVSIRPSPRLSACLHLCLTACLLVCPSVCRAGSLSLRTFLKPSPGRRAGQPLYDFGVHHSSHIPMSLLSVLLVIRLPHVRAWVGLPACAPVSSLTVHGLLH